MTVEHNLNITERNRKLKFKIQTVTQLGCQLSIIETLSFLLMLIANALRRAMLHVRVHFYGPVTSKNKIINRRLDRGNIFICYRYIGGAASGQWWELRIEVWRVVPEFQLDVYDVRVVASHSSFTFTVCWSSRSVRVKLKKFRDVRVSYGFNTRAENITSRDSALMQMIELFNIKRHLRNSSSIHVNYILYNVCIPVNNIRH